jgi:hypothetical protein
LRCARSTGGAALTRCAVGRAEGLSAVLNLIVFERRYHVVRQVIDPFCQYTDPLSLEYAIQASTCRCR